jgi:hypothetical protein
MFDPLTVFFSLPPTPHLLTQGEVGNDKKTIHYHNTISKSAGLLAMKKERKAVLTSGIVRRYALKLYCEAVLSVSLGLINGALHHENPYQKQNDSKITDQKITRFVLSIFEYFNLKIFESNLGGKNE